jgi:hypothetical protein
MRGIPLAMFAAIWTTSLAIPHESEQDVSGVHDNTIEHIAVPSAVVAVPEPIPSNGSPVVADSVIAYMTPKQDEPSSGMGMDMNMGGLSHKGHNATDDGPVPPEQMSYWLWPEHRGLLYAHIGIMAISWGFVLPMGKLPQNQVNIQVSCSASLSHPCIFPFSLPFSF